MDPEDGDDFDDIETFDEPEDQEGLEPEDDQDDPEPQGDDPLEDPEPARRPSRAQARIEALDREVREARERAEAAERRVNEVLNGQTRSETQQREQRERERVAQMLPEERAEYIARQTEERSEARFNALRTELAESTDRAEFATACASNPALAKVKDKVEAELTKLRASGQNVPRGTLAAFLIGQQVLEKAPKARERAAKRGAANLDRERARPASGASDAPRGRETNERAARDKRLENYTF